VDARMSSSAVISDRRRTGDCLTIRDELGSLGSQTQSGEYLGPLGSVTGWEDPNVGACGESTPARVECEKTAAPLQVYLACFRISLVSSADRIEIKGGVRESTRTQARRCSVGARAV
jgi:hypothetical protein